MHEGLSLEGSLIPRRDPPGRSPLSLFRSSPVAAAAAATAAATGTAGAIVAATSPLSYTEEALPSRGLPYLGGNLPRRDPAEIPLADRRRRFAVAPARWPLLNQKNRRLRRADLGLTPSNRRPKNEAL